MENMFRKGVTVFDSLSQRAYVCVSSFWRDHNSSLLCILGVALIVLGLNEISWAQNAPNYTRPAYNDTPINDSVSLLFALIEGSFGALIMVVAGLGAIVAAAFGAYRAAVGMLVVAVGAFVLRALVSLFFGDFGAAPGVGVPATGQNG